MRKRLSNAISNIEQARNAQKMRLNTISSRRKSKMNQPNADRCNISLSWSQNKIYARAEQFPTFPVVMKIFNINMYIFRFRSQNTKQNCIISVLRFWYTSNNNQLKLIKIEAENRRKYHDEMMIIGNLEFLSTSLLMPWWKRIYFGKVRWYLLR